MIFNFKGIESLSLEMEFSRVCTVLTNCALISASSRAKEKSLPRYLKELLGFTEGMGEPLIELDRIENRYS